jgi:hypothetical protein
MTNNIFLVTLDGERHEDHTPYEFMTYDNLIKKYEVSQSLHELTEKNRWFFIEDEDGININIIHVKENSKIPRT